jgi:zinc D-Ala-D-Ala carboxypeptidase
MLDWSKIKHFKKSDFDCHCGCGFNIISESLVTILDKVRDDVGFPIIITSGCRCQKYNDRLSDSVPDSSHLKGLAVDIQCDDSNHRFMFMSAFKANGIVRMGIAKSFVHCDIDSAKPQYMTWLYNM